MPTSADLIEMQREFEFERGLEDVNTVDYTLYRIQIELDEAVHASKHETDRDLLMELVDVQIFTHSLMGKMAQRLGWKPEDVDQLVEAKMAANEVKYDPAFFRNGLDPLVALKVAKHWYNLGLHEGVFFDYD